MPDIVVWDEGLLAEYTAREDQLVAKLDEVSDKLNQSYESDNWDSAKRSQYLIDQNRHKQVAEDLKEVRLKIDNMNLVKPQQELPERAQAFGRFLLRGIDGLARDEVDLYMDERIDSAIPGGGGMTFVIAPENITRSDDASGENLVQETVVPKVVESLAYYGGIAKVAKQFMTNKGGDYQVPNNDSKDIKGRIDVEQAVPVSQEDIPNFGNVTFKAFIGNSKTIRITRDMITDSVINLEAYANEAVVRRMGRAWDEVFTRGNKAASPEIPGVMQLAKDGVTTASNKAVTYSEMVSLAYTIDEAYRTNMGEGGEGGLRPEMGGTIGFLISDGLEQILMQMVDNDGRPIWRPMAGSALENPKGSMIFNYPYVKSGSLDGIGAGKTIGLFGNFSYYGIRTVKMVEIFRFQDSRTMQTNSIEILGFSRRDGRNCAPLVGGKLDQISALKLKA